MKNQNRFRDRDSTGILEDSRFRIIILALLMLIFLCILIFRSYYLQLHHGEEHREKIAKQSIRRIRIPGRRGTIFSADGEVLAGNRTVYDLVFYPEGMREGGGVRRTADAMFRCAGVLSGIIGRTDFPGREDILRHLNLSPGMPLTVFPDLNIKEQSLLLEAARDMKGLELQTTVQRVYPQNRLAAHIVGYARKAEASTADDRENFFYYQPDTVGKAGIEAVCDRLPDSTGTRSDGLGLRAYPGRQVVQVSNVGFVRRELLGKVEPVHGNNVYLTIDSRAQKIAEELLKDKVGAIVVLDADNGDIICSATAPGYELQRFTPRLSPDYYRSLLNDPGKPLINRAMGGIYPPGSTLKPLVCLALLKAGIDPKEQVFCSGSYEVLGTTIRCLAHRYTEADVDMAMALEKSCNSYMIHQSLKAGFPAVAAMLNAAGIGRKTGVEISESSGNYPDPAAKKKAYGIVWNDVDTALLSMGQGFISMTPLQQARYAAALCNGGKLYRPHLVYKVSDSFGEDLFYREVKCDSQLPVTPEQLEVVRQGMFRVVNSPRGSGRRAKSNYLTIYGKTGTAEVGSKTNRRNITHFIAFTSYRLRNYAIAVTVEDGSGGGTTCAPLAVQFFERFLRSQEDAGNQNKEN